MTGQTFFFYGSLMDREVLEAVLGRDAGRLEITPAWLLGYVAERAAGYAFPLLVERRDGRADGVIVRGLAAQDVARIAYFEDEEYTPAAIDVATAETEIAAQVYLGTTRLRSSGQAWSFDDWRKRERPLFLAVTRRLMAEHYGVTPPSQVDAAWRRIKTELETKGATPILLKPKRRPRTVAATPAPPRRAKRAVSPTRRPRGS